MINFNNNKMEKLKDKTLGRLIYTTPISIKNGAVAILLLSTWPGSSQNLAFCAPGKPASLEKQNQENIYRSIIADTFNGTICDTNLQIISDACAQNNAVLDDKSLKEAKAEDANAITAKIFSYVEREQRKIINFAADADTNAENRASALHHFGLLLRPMQDFYFRSNYLEMKIEQGNPLKLPAPYDIEPLRMSQVGRSAEAISRYGFEFGDIDKTKATDIEGQKVYQKAAYHAMCRELAIKETQRQWNTLEQLIKVKFSQKATGIITALKQSKCAPSVKFEDY